MSDQTTEVVFLGHDNKRDITKPSKLLKNTDIKIGEEVQCPRCGSWTYFDGSAHSELNECAGSCGLWYGTLGTAIQLTDERPFSSPSREEAIEESKV